MRLGPKQHLGPVARDRRGHGHRSLGFRLVALFLLLALASTAIVLGGMERVIAFGLGSVVKPLLADYVDHLAADIGSPPQVAVAQALEQRLPIRVHIEGPLVRYGQAAGWQRSAHRNASRGAAPMQADSPAQAGADGRSAQDESADGRTTREDGAEWRLSRRSADGHRISFSLAPGLWREGPRALGWGMLALLLLATALVFHAVRRQFRPIDEIGQGALRYGQGDFSAPIPVRRGDELGELAGQVNTMATELQRMLQAKRELLLAISHELRSPLTRARLNAELLREAGTASREHHALLRDLNDMKQLIEQLLEHERLSSGHRALHREPCDVAELLRGVVHEHFADQAVALNLAADLGQARLDTTRVRLALRNLIANALQHGAQGVAMAASTASAETAAPTQPVQVSAQRDAEFITLRVRDFGPGVPPEALPHLAEAFYRPDAARDRAQGGVGLGLALCRTVALAHGGSLTFANVQPGFEAVLRLGLRDQSLPPPVAP